MSSDFRIEYPVLAVDLGEGYYALERRAHDGSSVYSVALFTDATKATDYLRSMEITGNLKPFGTPAALWCFLQSLKAPIYEVAFNPEKLPDGRMSGQSFSIQDVVKNFLPNLATWSYPLFVIRLAQGYCSVDGTASGRGGTVFLCVFSHKDLANRYRKTEKARGTAVPLKNDVEFVKFLRSLIGTKGIILDPVNAAAGTRRTWVIEIASLLKRQPNS